MCLTLITDWATIYASVALTEHFVFRRGFSGYVPEDYNTPSKLPLGFAAIFSLGMGCVGVAMGMTQTWYAGPLSGHGDIGFELGCAFAVIGLLIAKPIELRFFERRIGSDARPYWAWHHQHAVKTDSTGFFHRG